VEYRYSSHWIHELESETHWRLYWRQQKLMRELVSAGDRVLEIGVGTGFTANYLRSKGVDVTTVDIDPDKRPDIVANIAEYDFPESYDAILAFEVFEHLPYDDFPPLLGRLSTAAKRHVFLSLPRNRRLVASFNVKLPKLKAKTVQWKVKRGSIVEPYHVWELDHDGVTVQSLEDELASAGFSIVRQDEAFDRRFYALATPSGS
jgi:SAM-dependent methyltransferase